MAGSADEVRRAAREILARNEFRRPPRSPVEAVREWVGRTFTRVLSAAGGGDVVGVVVAVLVAALLVFLLVRFARSVQADPSGGPEGPDHFGRPATDWRAEAAAHEAEGNWRQALRCRYRALVADLAARGLVEEVPGRTAGEYRAEVSVRAPGPAAADFAGVTELFERAWYGDAPTGPDENGRVRELSERVLEGAGR